ncbi:MAG: ribulose-phosphate 3-epimerase [Acidobacteriota bacterium]|nr:ribulose-phosphate 3-epimerase [Acidobacteriota bacterium]
MTIRLAPSLLSADFSRLADEIEDVAQAGADSLHLDLMDGHFVPNLTFGPLVVASLAGKCPIPLDAHLMVTDPDALFNDLAAAHVARIAVHVEACTHLQRTLQTIRDAGLESGVAINPATPLGVLEEVFDWVDFVLIMSVNPGFGGQKFLPQSVDKIRRLRAMAGDRTLDISVDGGVDLSNAGLLAAAGATTLIAGSAVFGFDDRAAALARLRAAAADGGPR